MRLLWLADVLRSAGLTVTEVSGWRTRGVDNMQPLGVLCHATAGSRTATTSGEINVLVNGSETAPPPIAQLYLARDGSWHVVASGLCYHAGRGYWPTTVGPNPGINQDNGNPYLIGIEAGNNNTDEPWSPVQYASYVRGLAAICRHLGWPVTRVLGHKEWSRSGKTDPTFSMSDFRARVTTVLTGQTEDDMDGSTVITSPSDVKIPGVDGPLAKSFAWWIAAQYAHILGAEAAAKTAAGLTADVATLKAWLAALRQTVEALGATLTVPVAAEVAPVDVDTLADKVAERILAEVGPDAIAQRIADRLGNG